ncbi:isochorismate synthase [Naasia sp. SYSU D00948]|uniref:isochorismate synthase n=1 Tax=Naasia sp. SYSU D00948 TaxID=2817379 RepID=UPI0027DADECB|nr:isochorismate synthase [Naasia sp. SYSU D00948]
MPSAPPPTLSVTTEEFAAEALLPYADPRHPLVWMRGGDGLVGLGEAVRLTFRGPDRFGRARAAWTELVARAEIADDVRVPGTGLVAFGTLAFADGSDRTSTVVVPRLIVGRRGGTGWLTRISLDGQEGPAPELHPVPAADYRIRFSPGRLTPEGYVAAVREGLRRIEDGALGKVVVARDMVGSVPEGSDLRTALVRLAAGYPECWTFAVDGLLGASPETLVRARGRRLGARVLAGSTARGLDPASDAARANALLVSAKDLDEHDFAVVSVLSALAPYAGELSASPAPFPLMLPNVWHLASDVTGVLAPSVGTLQVVEALHPTAAVAGFPTADALELIAELEPFDRGRYAGPVGWVDAAGDGEWAVALRCAQVDQDGTVTAYAGAGVVGGSDAERELVETTLKLKPVMDAFR